MKSSTKISSFLSSVWAELRKIAWPTRRETIIYTVTVIVMCIIVAAFLGLLDIAYLYLLQNFVF